VSLWRKILKNQEMTYKNIVEHQLNCTYHGYPVEHEASIIFCGKILSLWELWRRETRILPVQQIL
jgi:predicted solute-binding protein